MGYAALTTELNINGITNVSHASWDIHFENLAVKTGSVTPDSAATIDTDTSISYEVTLNQPGDFYEFTVDAKNDGSIDAMIESVTSKYNGVAISTSNPLPNYIEYSVSYSDGEAIEVNQLLKSGQKEKYKVRVAFKKDINAEDLPSSNVTLVLGFTVTYVQADDTAEPREYSQIIMYFGTNSSAAFHDSNYRDKIKTITLGDEINPPANVVKSWDVGAVHDGKVMAYLSPNATDSTKYDLFIQGDGHLSANQYSNDLFANLNYVDAIYNMNVLDTSNVTSMAYMFDSCGSSSTVFTLDLGDHFDTSKVTNMSSMFRYVGLSSTIFTLNLGNDFDTSNVTNMGAMFSSVGRANPNFSLNLGNKFNTSKVTNMASMFLNLGSKITNFNLDLGDKFDTSNVTDMHCMFEGAGYNSTTVTLDLGDHFDTSKVTTMNSMFRRVGEWSTSLNIDFGEQFHTNQVTDMFYMFDGTGTYNSTYELDLSTFDFSSVSSYSSILSGIKTTNKVYVANATQQNWIITNAGNSNLSTANVLIKN